MAVKDGAVQGVGLKQPAAIQGTMRPYQTVGVHWLVGLYENGLNGILGDEMGLGKTIQSIAMLAHLSGMGVNGPFMVVGPLSTLHNWSNEFKKWCPSMEAVIYHGSQQTRADLRGRHFRAKGNAQGKTVMPVMITSYEIVIRDIKELRRIQWKFLIIDEGHRLKNMNCRLIRELKTLGCDGCNRLLLTGTPLQNNLTELWSLLNFLLPGIFDDLDSFQQWFNFDFSSANVDQRVLQGELQQGVVTKLHQILRPFLLRRLKQDVEIGLPKKCGQSSSSPLSRAATPARTRTPPAHRPHTARAPPARPPAPPRAPAHRCAPMRAHAPMRARPRTQQDSTHRATPPRGPPPAARRAAGSSTSSLPGCRSGSRACTRTSLRSSSPAPTASRSACRTC